MTGVETKKVDMGQLQERLEAATSAMESAERELDAARMHHTNCRNRLNAAQSAVDAGVAQLRERAPRDSDWNRPKGELA